MRQMADCVKKGRDSFSSRADSSKKHESDTFQNESASTINESDTILWLNCGLFIFCTGGFILIDMCLIHVFWMKPSFC